MRTVILILLTLFTFALLSCKKTACENAEIIGDWTCTNCEKPHRLTVKTDFLTNCDNNNCVDWNYVVIEGTLFFASNVWNIQTLDCNSLIVNSKGIAIEFQRD